VIKALTVLEAADVTERRAGLNGTPLRWHLQMPTEAGARSGAPTGIAKRKPGTPR
jgi:hypothetical protein